MIELRKQFEKETENTFNCKECYYTKYKDCCPDENECPVEEKYKIWFNKKYIQLQKENEQLKNYLHNILSIIYRDGGHYEIEHGTKRAVTDVAGKLSKMRLNQDNLLFVLENTLEKLIEYPKHIPANRKEVMSGIIGGIQHALASCNSDLSNSRS